jgi:hypothetical protein
MIEEFSALVDQDLFDKSGKVFYSGRNAFSSPSNIYLLGINPGGCPKRQANETIKQSIHCVSKDHAAEWSAYSDECWEGRNKGEYGLQRPVLSLFKQLDLDIRKIPASNSIFVRSPVENALTAAEKKKLLEPKNSSRYVFDGMRIMHYQSHDAQSCPLSPSPDG